METIQPQLPASPLLQKLRFIITGRALVCGVNLAMRTLTRTIGAAGWLDRQVKSMRSAQPWFGDFARRVYSGAPGIYLEPPSLEVGEGFMLPALYGGNAIEGNPAGVFDFMVVLEAPSVSFTRRRWRTWPLECVTAEESVLRHRQIFCEWSSREPQAELFRLLLGGSFAIQEFFRRVYITDVWKDAGFRKNRKRSNPRYREYWLENLAFELCHVPVQKIVFVGSEAKRYGRDLVPAGKSLYFVPFPKRTERYRLGIQRLAQDLRVDAQEVYGARLSVHSNRRPTNSPIGVDFVSHSWTLNDAVNHNVFNRVPGDLQHIHMKLFYKRDRDARPFFISGSDLDLKELVASGLARKVEGGFWLRFVHDTRDHGIYLQLNGRCPRKLFASVPADAL